MNLNTIAFNRQALRKYRVLSKSLAGLVLTADQVKKFRRGQVNLASTYIRSFVNQKGNPELWLIGNIFGVKESSNIKLLLSRKEIARLVGTLQSAGQTIVPLRAFSVRGKIKLEIAEAVGKRNVDRRQEIRQRDLNREIRRELKDSFRT